MFIAFDGIDGLGKSTQVDFLEKYLKEKKRKYTVLTLGQNSYFKELINNISEKIQKLNERIIGFIEDYLEKNNI